MQQSSYQRRLEKKQFGAMFFFFSPSAAQSPGEYPKCPSTPLPHSCLPATTHVYQSRQTRPWPSKRPVQYVISSYSDYSKEHTYTMPRHNCFQKRGHGQRELIICRLSVDIILFSDSIVHFDSHTGHIPLHTERTQMSFDLGLGSMSNHITSTNIPVSLSFSYPCVV